MDIDGKTVMLRYVGGKLASPDAPGTGVWAIIDHKPTQWRGVVWGGPDVRYRAHKVTDDGSGDYLFTNEAHDCLAGADGGPHSPDLRAQMYHKPTGQTGETHAGALERWKVYDGNANGAIEAQIEQLSEDGHHIFVCPLSVEVVE